MKLEYSGFLTLYRRGPLWEFDKSLSLGKRLFLKKKKFHPF